MDLAWSSKYLSSKLPSISTSSTTSSPNPSSHRRKSSSPAARTSVTTEEGGDFTIRLRRRLKTSTAQRRGIERQRRGRRIGEQSRKKTKRLNRVGRKDAAVSMTSAERNGGVHLFRVSGVLPGSFGTWLTFLIQRLFFFFFCFYTFIQSLADFHVTLSNFNIFFGLSLK